MLSNPDVNTLRGIGFLYLACTHFVDGDLAEAERDLIVHKMQGRLVDADEFQVASALRTALSMYKSQPGTGEVGARVHQEAVGLRDVLEAGDLERLLADLVEMARIDGNVTSPERDFISDVAGSFGLARPEL